MIDIGGGSTEYVVGTPGQRPDFHVSTQAARSARPSATCTTTRRARGPGRAARDDARAIIEAEVPAESPRARRDAGIAVAGTATSLAAIDQQLDPYDPEQGARLRLLTRRAASACSRELAGAPARGAQRGHRPAPRPRADDRRRRRDPARVDAALRPRRRSRSPRPTSSTAPRSTRVKKA